VFTDFYLTKALMVFLRLLGRRRLSYDCFNLQRFSDKTVRFARWLDLVTQENIFLALEILSVGDIARSVGSNTKASMKISIKVALLIGELIINTLLIRICFWAYPYLLGQKNSFGLIECTFQRWKFEISSTCRLVKRGTT